MRFMSFEMSPRCFCLCLRLCSNLWTRKTERHTSLLELKWPQSGNETHHQRFSLTSVGRGSAEQRSTAKRLKHHMKPGARRNLRKRRIHRTVAQTWWKMSCTCRLGGGFRACYWRCGLGGAGGCSCKKKEEKLKPSAVRLCSTLHTSHWVDCTFSVVAVKTKVYLLSVFADLWYITELNCARCMI